MDPRNRVIISAAEPEGAPYLPFEGGQFRLAMGLMPLAPGGWIEIDAHFAHDLAAKRALLETRHADVFAALPGAAAPAAELLSLLAAHLPQYHPEIFRRTGDLLDNMVSGERWDVARSPLHPLDLCGRLVQEDFCVLQEDSGTYRLIGATLCWPSCWRLADKIGRPLAEIHAPVPGYAETLERPVDRFFAHLKPGRLTWRLNWTVVDDPAPFQPEHIAGHVPITSDSAGAHLWLRVRAADLAPSASDRRGGVHHPHLHHTDRRSSRRCRRCGRACGPAARHASRDPRLQADRAVSGSASRLARRARPQGMMPYANTLNSSNRGAGLS